MKLVPRLMIVVAVVLFSVVTVFPVSAGRLPTTAALPVLGNHTVKAGESLYCIGRAYQISPWAIAAQNGVLWPYTIFPNQVLQIPNSPWYNIPAGPVCVAQFTVPPQPTPTPGPAPTVAPTATPTPPCRVSYTVVPGDTLTSIAGRYASTVWAIVQANHIFNPNLIYPGQVLCIP
jgi:D-gamma-glutamyl-meso-diaminopimelic acid endopeptidase CwlS